ncbi:hypothetical protein V3851_07400 [Paenibacillus sp. M1]|uniref:Uncharacterized protein n=1 Tax=Paenibacillus haidiansis TaxID=1574488 RepID=A0ABU7VPH2_9BACL
MGQNDKVPGKLSPIEYEMIIDQMISDFPYMVRMFAEQAKLLKARFDSLAAAGFDAKQALEIIKARGLE